MEVLFKRLKWLREKKRYSQKEVAAEIGMKTVNGYQKIEMGERNPKLDVLISLAKLYSETTDFLLGLNGESSSLKEQRNKVMEYKMEFDKTKTEAEVYSFSYQEGKNRVQQLRSELLNNDNKRMENEVAVFEESLVKYKDRSKELYEKLFEIQKGFGLTVIDYLTHLIEIPGLDILTDTTIRSILPISLGWEYHREDDSAEKVYFLQSSEIGILGFITEEFAKKLEVKSPTLFGNEENFI